MPSTPAKVRKLQESATGTCELWDEAAGELVEFSNLLFHWRIEAIEIYLDTRTLILYESVSQRRHIRLSDLFSVMLY